MDSVSDRRVNVVGTLGGQNVRKNPKKVTEKWDFLRKTSFRPNRFFYIVSKLSFNFKLWGRFPMKNKHFPTVFKKIVKNKKKCDGKTGIFTQNQSSTKSFFSYGCNSKTHHCKYLKFSHNCYISTTTEIFN
ncbi:hypothetical protein FWK35_00014372, partial [Aphis craccivora]